MYHIFHDIEIHCLQDDLFSAFTQSEWLDKWWTVRSEGLPETDHVYRFYFSDEYDWRARVLECHKPDSMTFLMTDADEDWQDTMLSFEIMPINRQAQILRFEHRNWRSVNEHFRKTSYFWAMYLNDMKNLLEKDFHENKHVHA